MIAKADVRNGLLSLLLSLTATNLLAAQPEVHGELVNIDGVRVLRVWGTPTEMGFAHGYLAGDGIVTYLNDRIHVDAGLRALHQAKGQPVINVIDMPTEILTELRAIIDGMTAANDGDVPTLPALQRELTLEDLILFNAGDLLRAFGCSGFTVWGERAGDAGLITGRNFDFGFPSERALAEQLVIVRKPAAGKAVASVAIPGYLGSFTGLNEDGVCTFMHDGTGPTMHEPPGKLTPLAIVLTQFLHRTPAGSALVDAEQTLSRTGRYPFSYMVRVIAPVQGEQPPERVFRMDADGLSENPTDGQTCITTNHYLTKSGQAESGVNNDSVNRYQRIDKRLGTTVTSDIAWEALSEVSVGARSWGTLHSLVVFPQLGRLELAFCEYKAGKVIAAPDCKRHTIAFDDLFGE